MNATATVTGAVAIVARVNAVAHAFVAILGAVAQQMLHDAVCVGNGQYDRGGSACRVYRQWDCRVRRKANFRHETGLSNSYLSSVVGLSVFRQCNGRILLLKRSIQAGG